MAKQKTTREIQMEIEKEMAKRDEQIKRLVAMKKEAERQERAEAKARDDKAANEMGRVVLEMAKAGFSGFNASDFKKSMKAILDRHTPAEPEEVVETEPAAEEPAAVEEEPTIEEASTVVEPEITPTPDSNTYGNFGSNRF